MQRPGLDWIVRVGGTVIRAGFASRADAEEYLDHLEKLERKQHVE